jgi:predicted esterase
MGGCNEDMATLGTRLFEPGPHFKNVPMFLSNGEADPIANPQQGTAVKESMTRSGFTNVRLQTHEGKHELKQEHLRQALQWFAQTGGFARGSR